jgi:cell wall-associated NlpC family hydrolase
MLAGVVVTVLCCATLVSSARPAAAGSLASAQAQATAINAQLQADAQKVDTLSQAYDAAQQTVQQLNASLAHTRAAIGQDKQKVAVDRVDLRHDAVDAYMSAGDDSGLQTLFGGTGEKAVATTEYRSVATSNISGAVDALNGAETRLSAEQTRLQSTQSAAVAALAQVSASRQQAQATVSAQEATLAEVKGQIASLVAQQQAAAQAAQFAAFKKRVAAITAPAHSPARSPVATTVPALPSVPASGGGAAAVAFARSQLGVPYHWGGESPGVGFDCSGLTQWAWSRAGVGLPRTAQGQYNAIEHVSLAALEPGDLLFWGSGPGGISHVGMYVGGGEVIHAPETGEVVRIQPIWNSDLVGAGRP